MHDEQVAAQGPRAESPSALAVRCRLILCLTYPLLMATAIVGELAWLEAALLPLAAGVILAPQLARGRTGAWLVVFVVIALGLALRSQPALGMWPPVFITAAVGAWFGASLRSGAVPLIQRFAWAVRRTCGVHNVDDEASSRWMRVWTSIWALVLGASAIGLAWTAWSGQVTAWVGLTYALPVLMAVLLCGEYALRRVFLPHHAQMSLVGFLAALLATDWGDLAR